MGMNINIETLCQHGQAVVASEARAVAELCSRIDENFAKACQLILACRERVVVMGMGKSSHIGGKIAATLASTGTPAFFVHPGEASHGDLGMITRNDTVIAISHSGETPEILAILPLLKHLKAPLIAMIGNKKSTLAKASDVVLDVSVEEEACPLGLAPTSSSTASLVMGDALAVALLQARGFTAADFARSHPGGRLGRRLLLRVSDIMRTGNAIPRVADNMSVAQVLLEISQKALGFAVVFNAENEIAGIYTDGDLRRTLDKNLDVRHTLIKNVMSVNPKSVDADVLAVEALQLMEDLHIMHLLVLDPASGHLAGVIHLHDLLQAGVA